MPMPQEIHRPDHESAHDVLAAEAFAMPAPDPELRREPVVLPDDPTGISEPHDILAADEFAIPAARSAVPQGSRAGRQGERGRGFAVAAAAGGLLALLRARRHGR